MKLPDYLDALISALRANEHVVDVTTNESNLPYDTVRVIVTAKTGKRATCFVSAEKAEEFKTFEDGEDFERFLRVITP